MVIYIYPGAHKFSLSISHLSWDPQTLLPHHYPYFPSLTLSISNSLLSYHQPNTLCKTRSSSFLFCGVVSLRERERERAMGVTVGFGFESDFWFDYGLWLVGCVIDCLLKFIYFSFSYQLVASGPSLYAVLNGPVLFGSIINCAPQLTVEVTSSTVPHLFSVLVMILSVFGWGLFFKISWLILNKPAYFEWVTFFHVWLDLFFTHFI